jgi:hypothetical protein
VRCPEQDAPAPKVRPPGWLADPVGVAAQPSARQHFGNWRDLRSGPCSGKVAQPLEALQIICKARRNALAAEIDTAALNLFPSPGQFTPQDGETRRGVSGNRIVRHGE